MSSHCGPDHHGEHRADLGTHRHPRDAFDAGALAPDGAASNAQRLAPILVAFAVSTLVAAVILAVWTRPGPYVLSADSGAAIRAECADRVAFGLSPDMPTCTSWAAEIRSDAQLAQDPASPLVLVLAIATGLLTGMGVHLVSARAVGRPRSLGADSAVRSSAG